MGDTGTNPVWLPRDDCDRVMGIQPWLGFTQFKRDLLHACPVLGKGYGITGHRKNYRKCSLPLSLPTQGENRPIKITAFPQ